jgi:hypothetical protein
MLIPHDNATLETLIACPPVPTITIEELIFAFHLQPSAAELLPFQLSTRYKISSHTSKVNFKSYYKGLVSKNRLMMPMP